MTVDDYLASVTNEGARDLFRRFQAMVEACGPSEPAARKTIVYWKRTRIFAGAFVLGRRLELNIDLLRKAEHPCLLAAFPHTKRVITHRLRIASADQLDAPLGALLAEAYAEVGPGTRTRRVPA
ncbi:MAG TPA: DUF5655 domain-containing protein [Gaiellaceae bacterium]|nr:DUF5655 domain-containing protein [Gaiellaceae bacterium]